MLVRKRAKRKIRCRTCLRSKGLGRTVTIRSSCGRTCLRCCAGPRCARRGPPIRQSRSTSRSSTTTGIFMRRATANCGQAALRRRHGNGPGRHPIWLSIDIRNWSVVVPHSRLLLESAVIDAGRDAAGAARRDRQAPDGFYSLGGEFSEDVPAAQADHQQLADMLAVTARLGTSTPAFEEQLRSLQPPWSTTAVAASSVPGLVCLGCSQAWRSCAAARAGL